MESSNGLDTVLQARLKRLMAMAPPGVISQSKIARGASTSPTYLSQYLNSTPGDMKVKGDLDRLQKKLGNYVDREMARLVAPSAPAYVETETSQEIVSVLRICHVERVMGVIVGPPGSGKTFTIKQYAQEVAGDLVHLECNESWRMKAAVSQLAKALGLDGQGQAWRLVETIVETLADTGRLVVVDEAQCLSYETLEVLRSIHDRAGMGLVLSGMKRLHDNMIGRERGLFAHLYSRVARCAILSGDVDRVDVQRIVTQVFPAVNGEVVKAFQDIAGDPKGGRLRTLRDVVCHVQRHLNIHQGEKISADLVRDANQLLMTAERSAA